MSRRLSASIGIIAAAGLAFAVGGCQQKPTRPPCPPGKVCLEYGNTVDPNSLDPAKTNLTNEATIVSELFEGLTRYAPDGAPIPGMAASWETSADGRVWTFHLRQAVWSDGVPVTAGDFVYAYRRMLAPATASSSAYLLYVLKGAQAVNQGKAPPASLGAEAPDARTLRLILDHPAPYLPQLLAHHSFYPVPERTVRRWGEAWTRPGRLVGDGAYILTRWRLGDFLRLEKNPRYWDADKVCVDRIDFYPTSDSVSAERRVRRGELDVNANIQSNRVDHLRRDPVMRTFVRIHPYLATYYLALNVRRTPALQDLRVRQALGMALDRRFITDKLLRAGQTPTTAFVPAQIAGYLPPEAVHPAARWAAASLPERQANARRLLAAAGYTPDRPLRIQLKTSSSGSGPLLAQAAQADLQAVGVQATLAQEEGQVLFQSINAGDFEMAYVSWIADYNDPLTFLDLLRSDTGAQNYGGYDNPSYDALLNQAATVADPDARAAILARAEQIMLDDAYVIPVYNGVNTNLVNPAISGWRDNPVDFHPARYLCRKP